MAFDLCIVTDYTSSMSSYLKSLKQCITEFIPTFKLLIGKENVDRMGVFGYGDYCDPTVTMWSGWKQAAKDLVPFVSSLEPYGGGDVPEAAKTAAWELSKVIEKRTVVIWYTDAPPHTSFSTSNAANIEREKSVLGADFDWTKVCHRLAEKDASVWVLLPFTNDNTISLYTYMSAVTGGRMLVLKNTSTQVIGETTIGIVLSIMGHKCVFNNVWERYFKMDIKAFANEKDLLRVSSATKDLEVSVAEDANLTLIKSFESDQEFKSKVYDVFEEIITPALIKSVTYNPVFGGLWRAICKDKQDPRKKALLNSMSSIINSLKGEDKDLMQTFIKNSYNQEDEIVDIIESCGQEAQYPAVRFNGVLDKTFDISEMMELTRSCSPSSLRKLSEYVRMFEIVDAPQTDKERTIPLALSDKDLFSCLPHLILKGTMFSLRPAIVFAMLIAYTGARSLYDRAVRFLLENKGKWLVADQPENFAFEFIKFALKVQAKVDFLTEEEHDNFKSLYWIGGLKINQDTVLNIKTPFTSNKTLRRDYKRKCPKCDTMRSFTLLDEHGVCGICLSFPGESAAYPCVDKERSVMCECRTCMAHYAVENVADLNVEPKCHFCRNENKVAPFVSCDKCSNKYVCCIDIKEGANSWICPVCDDGCTPAPQETQLTLYEYFAHNGNEIEKVFDARSLWVVYDCLMERRVKMPSLEYAPTHKKKPILNLDELKTRVESWVGSGRAERGTCQLCFEEKHKRSLHFMCDRKRCSAQACQECLTSWYGQVQPGRILNATNLNCPYCRCRPSTRVIKKFNNAICSLKEYPKWDSAWHYAWCVRCNKAKQYMERVCAATIETVHATKEFVCEDCTTAPSKFKHCPECGVAVEKTSGCDHITCACGTHWCFECGIKSTYDDIYKHMHEAHGGFGIIDGEEYYSDDE